MKTYEFTVATDYIGSEYAEEVEFEDDITEDEVHEYFIAWVWDNIETGYNEVE